MPTCQQGHEMAADHAFCPICGSPPGAVEPRCVQGHPIGAADAFCSTCGSPAAGDAPLTPSGVRPWMIAAGVGAVALVAGAAFAIVSLTGSGSTMDSKADLRQALIDTGLCSADVIEDMSEGSPNGFFACRDGAAVSANFYFDPPDWNRSDEAFRMTLDPDDVKDICEFNREREAEGNAYGRIRGTNWEISVYGGQDLQALGDELGGKVVLNSQILACR